MKHILFSPIYQERVWGGKNLGKNLGRTLPVNKIIGESWEIVDRPEAQSTTTEGTTLREMISSNPEALMGHGWPASRPFPILVKWLDCQEKLSLQVHPPAAIASELNGEPKSENWYIAEAAPHATLIAGLKNGVTRKAFEAGLQSNNLEPLLHTISAKAGESIFIPSGRLHAIGGGNLILEIQQNSDTTYRVWDWERIGLNGKPRDLHLDASLQSTNFNDFEPKTLKTTTSGEQIIAQSDVFKLRKVCITKGDTLNLEAGEPRILSLISGQLTADDEAILQHGDNALLPACHTLKYTANTASEVLITEDFA